MGIYPEKTINQNDTFTLMFIAALFTVARAWIQPECLYARELIKKE